MLIPRIKTVHPHMFTTLLYLCCISQIDRLVTQEGWTGIHGPLIDLFKPKKEEFMIAAEVVANTQLFNVVVDDDRVAARCIEHLQRTKKGRVTFVPLGRIQTSRPKYPKSADCLPLVDRLRYNPQHEKVSKRSRHPPHTVSLGRTSLDLLLLHPGCPRC